MSDDDFGVNTQSMDLMTALQLVMKKSAAHDGRKCIHILNDELLYCWLPCKRKQSKYALLSELLCFNLALRNRLRGESEESGWLLLRGPQDHGEESEGLNIVHEYVKSQ
uniref:Uncharacterized protein n=1 Tax=Ananas comosus var. bracteatus TaxID=296719 RepID=A0A6V7PBE7_ANACO|nr:unnamed protein product [Ananas comosus var. bracteatus]